MTSAAIVLFFRTRILPILTFTIALPLWVFLVVGIWLYFDKSSAIRTAVNKAVTELVAGAELSALNAQLVEERRIRANNCTKPDDKDHRCWVRHGTLRGTIHVDKNGNTCAAGAGSIAVPGFHGFLHHGVLRDC